MARKLEEDLDTNVEKSEPKASRKKSSTARNISIAKATIYTLLALIVVGAGVYLFHIVERFLILDTRFALNGPDGSEDAATFAITGAAYSSSSAIREVFRDDLGKSVYLLPSGERRDSLLAVSWVKDAAISRQWPNRVEVRVWERTPVALVPGREGTNLIDADGVILAPVSTKFRLPVLRGVGAMASQVDRKERVRRMLRLLDALGESANEITEVDVADQDNLKVAQSYSGHALRLLLGDRNFSTRYQNFKHHFEEIRRRLPDAVTLDLRLEDRITVVE